MKYVTVYDAIKNDIVAGTYPPNSKIPHTKDLLKLYACSFTTLRHAITLLEREGILRGIPSKGTFVRTYTEPIKFKASEKRKPLLAFLGSAPFTTPQYDQMHRSIYKYMRDLGGKTHPILCGGKTIHDLVKEINSLEINMMITLEFYRKDLRKEIESLNIPVVHIDMLDVACRKPSINPNNVQGGALAFKKLYDIGHRNILFINNVSPFINDEDPAGKMRWLGFSQECKSIQNVRVHKETLLSEGAISEQQEMRGIEELFEKYHDFTGFVFGTGIPFSEVKTFLKNNPRIQTTRMDFVVFSLGEGPEMVNRKPVWFCKWDAKKMGEIAVKTLLDSSKSYPKAQYLPMFIEKNC
ncbi:MAG: hypothetical protein A2268_00325 [Candidatus Raymondbacteria bacterium RifOxyA12_full_50_37]|uniref:HTH gntR-type domain-containing protein n=1 Tax=Candidatus Raymondbacteria bacterium RIFOXYD12_FULL_49_13 TaxID=1817890 RepID=A0A1F7F2S3_UNCRA|nr:MAG: hypothetical protein A2268_00325 [Candidatus Raymondbacteria bacterium RifOxyA12_full_50_37]OGJ92762.1 MAG: hypothetical protein A2248_04375 [Candidatus Raymondbacteria bacterium RIFOXYA2_FULL_49_16]OGK00965.1 MAG: hypothetical protein A2519_17035 [Candidatus Raymondbacteria bacterium RIFOXYD12_FULL_49_13]OGK04159.1 MAG: hypothetical protein A2350_02530 [Candidatus Raymondbacteria bacterium RifOxyB12_full_50_8]OGK04509.1 MAG: hypothetical protein A2487_16085 [Candidatus Raymondbacteria 